MKCYVFSVHTDSLDARKLCELAEGATVLFPTSIPSYLKRKIELHNLSVNKDDIEWYEISEFTTMLNDEAFKVNETFIGHIFSQYDEE